MLAAGPYAGWLWQRKRYSLSTSREHTHLEIDVACGARWSHPRRDGARRAANRATCRGKGCATTQDVLHVHRYAKDAQHVGTGAGETAAVVGARLAAHVFSSSQQSEAKVRQKGGRLSILRNFRWSRSLHWRPVWRACQRNKR